MSQPEKRFAIVLDASLPCGLSHNTAAHLAAQLGTLYPALSGKTISDASGTEHAGLPIYPNVILKASPQELQERLVKARDIAKSKDLIVIDYIEYATTTATEAAYHEAVSVRQESEMQYFGFLLFGPRNRVKKLTYGLRLWDRCGDQHDHQGGHKKP